MTDLAVQLVTARTELGLLWAAWDRAWQVDLDCGPGGVDLDRGSASRAQRAPAESSPIRYDRDGQPRSSQLSTDFTASVRQLHHAWAAAGRLSFAPTAAIALDPRASHVSLAIAQQTAREVRYAIEACGWRTPLDVADYVHAATMCEQVTAALCCMPDDMVVDGSKHRVCSGAPLAPPCTRVIPKSHTRCPACRQRVSRARQADPDQRKAS